VLRYNILYNTFLSFFCLILKGIGRASALAFLREGASLIVTDADISKLADFGTMKGVIKIAKVDVTSKSDISSLAKDIEKVDIIFNCAG
jgi:NAD(P)-dependent dehydrogenase (short-subunit alcohol dehydrogenase family)